MSFFMIRVSVKRAIPSSDRARSIKILSGKPEERRELFDEAAGIVKFKRRKAIAQKKLEDEKAEPDPRQRIFCPSWKNR